MNRSNDLRQQLNKLMKQQQTTQGDLARARGVAPQTVGLVFTGKRPLINRTLEAALDLLGSRLLVSRLEENPQAVSDKAFVYGFNLFPKAPKERHEAFGSVVAWLTTGQTKNLSNTLRSLAVQSLFAPRMSLEQAVFSSLPLIYGELSPVHKSVVILGSQGDDFWDSRQIALWQAELGMKQE